MLEVKGLKKIYKSKKGVDVHALDGVTLQFPAKGLVFLLGKSGSGKSTLLNVCGGLDAPTEGEVIVKGRSSKDFSQSDFDSYRNTFVGFIFQEYNILNEFSVEDNIGLALELQGKSKDKAAIAQLLKDVDLEGFAKRKPNTLSGGQKQRIAIARALIKAPEIIMADEPTGALDSNTGKQVFDTLKKLSKNKLIIVVSHDRDFAEQYGDRIIELQDGKVLSDVTKTEVQQEIISPNIAILDDVISIKKGTDLTEQDFDKIKDFLKQSKEDVIIANNGKDVKNFKKVSRINDSGEKEVFCDTDMSQYEKKEYTKEESRFIRSKLPLRHAFKIGVSSLRTKPFRLIFTILLCTVAFVMFSLLTTLNLYDSEATFLQTMKNAKASMVQLEKQYRTEVHWFEKGEEVYDYEGISEARFTKEEVQQQIEELSPNAFGGLPVYDEFNIRQSNNNYWINSVQAYAVLPENNCLREQIHGAYPKTADEIMITSYTANVLFNCGAYGENGALLNLTTPNDILGKKLNLNGAKYTVTGILDTGEIPETYDVLKDSADIKDSMIMEYNMFLQDGLYLIVFVNEERLNVIAKENPIYVENVYSYTEAVVAFEYGGEYEWSDYANVTYADAGSLTSGKDIIPITDSASNPKDNEVLVPSSVLGDIASDVYQEIVEDKTDDGMDYAMLEKYYKAAELAESVRQGGVYVYNEATKEHDFKGYTDTEYKNKTLELIALLKRDNINLTIGMKLYDNNNSTVVGDLEKFVISGILVENTKDMNRGSIILSDKTFSRIWDVQKVNVDSYPTTETKYKNDANAIYGTIYLPFEYSEQVANQYWEMYDNKEWKEDDSRLKLAGTFVNNLEMVDELVKELSQIFLYVGLVLALFAVLLFSNFITVSISQKTKEIGILRAVGARSADVFRIFFSESFVISAICVFVSTIASVVICGFLNQTFAQEIGAAIFVFGVASFAILVLVALVTAFAATFLPVYHAAKKKPVDSIRSL